MATTKPNMDDALRALTEHAPRLRKAGVRTFTVDLKTGAITAELVPHEEAPSRTRNTDEDAEMPRDPFEDPALYGRIDGKAPGFELLDDNDD